MKVKIVRSGGFAGLIRSGEKDFSALSPEQKEALRELLSAGVEAPPQRGADRFVYKIEVQDEHGIRSMNVAESAMPACLARIAAGQ
jgi:hypothetical protein